ncbi:MAG: Ig-like domain-containing protein [Christensenellaceae bacterium]|nr:Ig-like domain-containing protein [Christensenellaceae bacterium]
MKKFILPILFILTTIMLLVVFASCSDRIKVDRITIDAVDVELAVTGEYSRRQINAQAMPADATNRKLNFFLANTESQQYISVTSSGEVYALGIITPEDFVCVVRVNSVSDPSVYVDINVVVKTGEIERILFATSEIKLTLDEASYQLAPIIQPTYASANAVLTYNSTNPEIATVSSGGLVTPVSKGETNIEVFASEIYSMGAAATIKIKVGYAPLNYGIRIRDNLQAVYKQVLGIPESFVLEIFKNNEDKCDPDPEIIWQRNGSAIQGGNFQGMKTAYVNPVDIGMITVGEHVIRAILRSVDDEQTLTLPAINIYNPLATFNVVKLNAGNEFNIGDTIAFRANHGAGQYPPDNYVWNLLNVNDFDGKTYTDTSLILKEKVLAITLPQKYDDRDVGTYNFMPTAEGEYYIVGYPVVNGVRQDGSRRLVYVGRVGTDVLATDIFGVYFDGYKRGESYLPYVKWNPLPYDGEINVIIKNLTDTSKTLTLSSYSDPNYFPSHYGVLIPAEVATFTDSFSIRIKSARYGYSQEYVYEAETITSQQNTYLEEDSILGFNRYISNIDELGDLLNYFSTFRPAEYKTSQFNGTAHDYAYKIDVYIPFTYSQIKEAYDSDESALQVASIQTMPDAGKLIWVAFNCFVDTGKAEYIVTVKSDGAVTIELKYFNEITVAFESTSKYTYLERPMAAHYTSKPGERQLAIDKLGSDRTMVVTTSNQLFYAVSKGYRPVPVVDSAAEKIYNLARSVLYRIIDDTMSDAQKIHAIYDYLTLELFYDYELVENLSTYSNPYLYDGFYLEGVFEHGKAVCDGIAKAFNLLSWMEGIMSLRVAGETQNATTTASHAWNITFIAGSWYASDATWGNIRENEVGANYEHMTHSYLLVTNERLSNNHKVYGVIPDTASVDYEALRKASMIVDDSSITHEIADTTPLNDLITFIDQKLIPIKDEAHDIWIEFYLADVFIANYDSLQAAAGYLGGLIEATLRTSQDNSTIAVSYIIGADLHCVTYVIKIPVTD